jgi:hypothetical protein
MPSDERDPGVHRDSSKFPGGSMGAGNTSPSF